MPLTRLGAAHLATLSPQAGRGKESARRPPPSRGHAFAGMSGGVAVHRTGHPMAPPTLAGKDWPRIRHDYEHTDKPNHEICAEHGISASTLRNRVRQWNWTRRRAPVPAEGPPAEAATAKTPPLVPVAPAQAARCA